MSYKLLIVDDMPENLSVIGNILLNNNYEVVYSNSGKDAILKANNNIFDLILLDIIMPEMDGYEVCKILKTSEKTSKIPIIFLTSKTDSESIIKGFEHGAQDYLTRPFNPKELIARVQTHLELKDKREELEELNILLEEKVKERTLKLEKANKKIESLDEAKSAFLGLMSHEIRTPLNGIIGFLEILKQNIKDENKELVEMAFEAAVRLNDFSELSLLITQLNINSYQLQNKKHDFIAMIEKVKEKIQNKWQNEKQLKFNQIINTKTNVLRFDNNLIEKVIYSIIDNAVKFSSEEVKVDLNVYSNLGYLVCEIHDNGSGFTAEALSFAFEPFVGDKQRDIEGFGLNLAAAKLIMQAHEGKIEIENKPVKGVKVSLFLKETF